MVSKMRYETTSNGRNGFRGRKNSEVGISDDELTFACDVLSADAVSDSRFENRGSVTWGPVLFSATVGTDLDNVTLATPVTAMASEVIDFAVLQYPGAFSLSAGVSSEPIYGRVFEAGITNAPGQSTSIIAQLGYGPWGSDPSMSSWIWVSASFTTQIGNDDEYVGTFTVPADGSYLYTYRFAFNDGSNVSAWTYADRDGNGVNVGLGFSPAQLGRATIGAGGGAQDDIIEGNSGNEQLFGGAGNDTLYGAGGADQLFGGDDNDLLYVDAADTVVDGGNGTDTALFLKSGTVAGTFSGLEALHLVNGATVTFDHVIFQAGFAANSNISGIGSLVFNMTAGVNFLSQNLVFSGGGVTVTVNGTSGIDIIKCGTATHIINSGDGVDQIRGGTSADTINAGAGNDKIIGFTGADIITGGTGNDQFRYMLASDSGLGASADRITDYAIGGDRLNFLAIDTDAVTPGDQGFAFVGNGAFSGGGTASIRFTNSGTDLLVQADVNGDGIADMEIILQGLNGSTLTAGDFIL